MGAYIVPDWLTVIAGMVIYQRRPEPRVLFGLRSARVEAGKWCLPTGLGAIRRDISSALAADVPESLKDSLNVIQSLPERLQQAFLAPGGFALAEAKWYIQIPPEIGAEQLTPLRPVCQLDDKSLLVKIYFGLEWNADEPPNPAKTEWPFKEVRFFTREELRNIPVAFGCEKDLEDIFWFWL